jgi:hypothetical protein
MKRHSFASKTYTKPTTDKLTIVKSTKALEAPTLPLDGREMTGVEKSSQPRQDEPKIFFIASFYLPYYYQTGDT